MKLENNTYYVKRGNDGVVILDYYEAVGYNWFCGDFYNIKQGDIYCEPASYSGVSTDDQGKGKKVFNRYGKKWTDKIARLRENLIFMGNHACLGKVENLNIGDCVYYRHIHEDLEDGTDYTSRSFCIIEDIDFPTIKYKEILFNRYSIAQSGDEKISREYNVEDFLNNIEYIDRKVFHQANEMIKAVSLEIIEDISKHIDS